MRLDEKKGRWVGTESREGRGKKARFGSAASRRSSGYPSVALCGGHAQQGLSAVLIHESMPEASPFPSLGRGGGARCQAGDASRRV